jgi:RHS repeat-associated protein
VKDLADDEMAENWTYGYDLLNRLTEVRKNGTIVGEYGYDPVGLRVIKKKYVNGVFSEKTHYVFQGLEPIYTKNVTTGKVKSYVYALGRVITRVDGVVGDTAVKKYWYHSDQVGSVKAVTNQAGNIVWNADYLPFGQQYMKNKLDPEFEEDDLGFTGKGYDADVGLSYFNARWYDADTGRFISEDPVGDPSNPNLYTYGRNNPLSFIDPTGLETSNPGHLSTNTAGAYGYDNGSGGVPKGGPSWVIPGAMESKDKDGNRIWIWGNLTNGIFSTNTPMSDFEIWSLFLENGFVDGVFCQTPGDLEEPGSVHFRNINWKSESEIEQEMIEKDRAMYRLEQVNYEKPTKQGLYVKDKDGNWVKLNFDFTGLKNKSPLELQQILKNVVGEMETYDLYNNTNINNKVLKLAGLDIRRDFDLTIRFKQINSNMINTKITILQSDAIYMKDKHFKNFISFKGTTTNYYIRENEYHGTRYFNAEYNGQDYKYSVDTLL